MKKHIVLVIGSVFSIGTAVAGGLLYGDQDSTSSGLQIDGRVVEEGGRADAAADTVARWRSVISADDLMTRKVPI